MFRIILEWQRLFQFVKKAHLLRYLIITQLSHYISIFNKILVRLIYNRLIKYFEQSSIFFDQQFGFRSNHSTVHALILMVDKIQKAIDSGNYSRGIFIDLCKAFDAVDHLILLDKLEYYSIRA